MSLASKFSLILMHDDGRTHRMRISRGMFRLLLALLVLSPLLGLLGLWIGVEAWRTMAAWQQEKLAFRTRIDDMRVRLERLSTLEALLRQEEAGPGRPVLASAGPARPGPASPQAEAERPPAPVAAPEEPRSAQETATPPAAPNQPDEAAPGTTASAPAAPGEATESAPPDERRKAVDAGIIRVENMQARLIDRRRVRASADLYNAEAGGRQLGGRTEFSLLTADGRQFPLTNEDAAFRISRFKKVVTTSPLPVAASELDNAAVVVEVTVDGKLVYRNLFSIESR